MKQGEEFVSVKQQTDQTHGTESVSVQPQTLAFVLQVCKTTIVSQVCKTTIIMPYAEQTPRETIHLQGAKKFK